MRASFTLVPFLAMLTVSCTAILGSFEVDPSLDGKSADGGPLPDGAIGADGSTGADSGGGGDTGPDGAIDDPKRCGIPTRDCEGGACIGGTCQPFTLAKFTSTVTDISVQQAGDVFVIERPATLWKVAKNPGVGKVIAGQFAGSYEFRGVASALASPDTFLLTFSGGSTQLRKVETTGLTPFGPATSLNSFDIATTGARTYFTGPDAAPNGGVFDAKAAVYSHVDGTKASVIAADEQLVFWSQTDGNIYARDPAGPLTGTVITAQGTVSALSVRAAPLNTFEVVWGVGSGGGAVRTCNFKAPAGPCIGQSDIVKNQKDVSDVLLFDKTLFWIERSNGAVSSCGFPACIKTNVHARGEDVPTRLAADANAIYFITKSEVRKVIR